MNAIGIRVAPKEIHFTIIDLAKKSIISIDKLIVPLALSTPEKLKFIRNNLLDILTEYDITKAGIRIPESNAQTISIERTQIEGVIQELFASSTLTTYYIGQIASISKKINIDRSDFKKFISGELDFKTVENWNNLTAMDKESLFTALGCKDD